MVAVEEFVQFGDGFGDVVVVVLSGAGLGADHAAAVHAAEVAVRELVMALGCLAAVAVFLTAGSVPRESYREVPAQR